jgi:hypothetical protein
LNEAAFTIEPRKCLEIEVRSLDLKHVIELMDLQTAEHEVTDE